MPRERSPHPIPLSAQKSRAGHIPFFPKTYDRKGRSREHGKNNSKFSTEYKKIIHKKPEGRPANQLVIGGCPLA